MRKKRTGLIGGAVALVVILGLVGYGFYRHVHVPRTPSQAFWNALTFAMTTDGVTCTVHDKTATRDSTQAVSLDLAGKSDATSKTTLTQNGSTVQTDGISTATDDYVRYTSIRANVPGKTLNFSPVLGVWGKEAHTGNASLFQQTALGGCVLPLAKLTDSQAADMVADMRKNSVFKTDYNHPSGASDNGVSVLRYSTTVPPTSYVPFMKRFAATYGLRALDTVDAGSYSGQAPKSITIDIDAGNDRVYQIGFTGQNHTIRFSDYGKRPKVSVPSKTIAMADLQQRLQSIK